MSDKLFVDIETVHATKENVRQIIIDKVAHPKNIKLEKSIKEWEQKKKPFAIIDALSKTSFNGLYGEICCISWAVNDQEVKSVYRDKNESEKDMLEMFWHQLYQDNGQHFNPIWVGHNLCDFDLPFIFQRCFLNKVRPSLNLPHKEKPWGKNVYDTLYEATGSNVAGGSLNALCSIAGIGTKLDGMNGSMVNQEWLDDNIKDIVKYCQHDIELTRELYKRLNFLEEVGHS